MCVSTRTKYSCGHKGHRKLKQCSKARKLGSPDESCGNVSEEKHKTARLCSSCNGPSDDYYAAKDDIARERVRTAEKLVASSSRAHKRDGMILRPIENKAPPRLHERAFLDQGNREAFEYDSSSRRKSRASGLKAPPRLSERAPLEGHGGNREAFEYDSSTRRKSRASGLKAPPRLSERAPLESYDAGFDSGLDFTKPPKKSDRYAARKSVAIAPKAKEETTRSRKKSIFGGLFSRDSDASFACADARKIEGKSSRRKSRW